MKTNKFFCRIAGLLLPLIIVFTTCGWLPFTAPVTIHSTPEGAKVYLEGKKDPVGVTPFKTRVFLKKRQYEVKLDKFFTEPVELNFDSPKNIYIKMRLKPVLVYTTPAAKIYPVGSDTALGSGSVEVNVFPEDREYIVKADGYRDQRITIGPSTESPQVIELKPLPVQ